MSTVQDPSTERDIEAQPPQADLAPQIRDFGNLSATVESDAGDHDDTNGSEETNDSNEDEDSEEYDQAVFGDSESQAKLIADAVARLTLTHQDVLILVMGMTGVGKSRFISHLTEDNVKEGHSLASCTADIGIHPVPYPGGRTIYLIDTPGFDDDKRCDTDILDMVACFLAAVYKKSVQLAGIIYLHRINDNRMGRKAMINLSMFQKLCGTRCLPNVVLATTMWDKLESIEAGTKTEQELKEDFWGGMINFGSQVKRQDDGPRSALKIVDAIMELREDNVLLDIVDDLVNKGRVLAQTAAGGEVQKDILKERKRHAKQMKRLEEDKNAAIEAGDLKTAAAVAEMQADIQKKDEAHKESIEKLNSDFKINEARSQRRHEEQLATFREQAKKTREKLEKIETEKKTLETQMSNTQTDLKNVTDRLKTDADAHETWKTEQNDKHNGDMAEMQRKFDAAVAENQQRSSKGMGLLSVVGGGFLSAVGVVTLNPALGVLGASMITRGAASL